MNRDTLAAELNDAIKMTTGANGPFEDSTPLASICMDSLETIELMIALEVKFEKSFDDSLDGHVHNGTYGDLLNFLCRAHDLPETSDDPHSGYEAATHDAADTRMALADFRNFVDRIETRAMACDGPVTPFLDELYAASDEEKARFTAILRGLYKAAPDPKALPIGTNHPDARAVDRFAVAMKAKLAKKRAEGRCGWDDPEQCHIDYLVQLLMEQIHERAVLDPVDIGNLAMMIHQRPETPTPRR